MTRVSSDHLIYTGSFIARSGNDSKAQVTEVFEQLGELLKKSGSDFRHLAKATYFVANDDCSKQLNAIRPKFYDPNRPPAASKALVDKWKSGIAIDMIAMPSIDRKKARP